MRGISFDYTAPISAAVPTRMDVACFIGFVSTRPGGSISSELLEWWQVGGFEGDGGSISRRPVPLESWEAFRALFDDRRTTRSSQVHPLPPSDTLPVDGDGDGQQEAFLAAAVRAFFQHGGRKCYVIPMGDPPPYFCPETVRAKKVLELFWGDALTARLDPEERFDIDALLDLYMPALVDGNQDMARRQSLTYLMDLSDVTYLSFPDLVDLFSIAPAPMERRPEQPKPEVFVACSREENIAPWFYLQPFQAPRFSTHRYRIWKRFIELILEFLEQYAPTIQMVATLPLPDLKATDGFETHMIDTLLDPNEIDNDRYRRLQLAFPWLKTVHAAALPEWVQPPEGTLLGLLAAGALTRGAYRSIAGVPIPWAYDLLPLHISLYERGNCSGTAFFERICCFDRVPAGISLQSDVTAVGDRVYRYAVVRRIMIMVLKAARTLGLNHVFDASGPRLWKGVEEALAGLLIRLYQKQGLRGATAGEAFSVVCDRSTMTQQDIDSGRVIVQVSLQPAIPIEQITVNLAIDSQGTTIVSESPGSA